MAVATLALFASVAANAGTARTESDSSRSLLIVDGAVDAPELFLRESGSDRKVFFLRPDEDGLKQISAILSAQKNINNLHLVSHGKPGRLQLGSTSLDHTTLIERASEVLQWKQSLGAGSDVLLYGCSVAEGDGYALVQALADILDVDVAASTNLTASRSRGGDWRLERATGPIEARSIFTAAITESPRIALALPEGFADELVVNTGSEPIDVAFLSSTKMLVLERGGRILVANPQSSSTGTSTFLTIPNVDSGGEKGLLSIAIDPNFSSNNYFYVYYHNSSVDRARISRFKKNSGDSANLSSEFVIWQDHLPTANQQVSDHWGGGFGFGPDNNLYLAIGDKKDNPTQADDLNFTAGKIIRLRPAGATSGAQQWQNGGDNSHLLPSGNPYPSKIGGEIWARGLRNPFRARWDFQTGKFFIGEVGGNIQSGDDRSWEDIHRVTTGNAGVDFGWPECEGPTCVGGNPPNYSAPIFSIRHTDSRAIIIGPVYRGNSFPSTYQGALFFADYEQGWLRYLKLDGNGNVLSSNPVGGYKFTQYHEIGVPVSLVLGPDGALYYANWYAKQIRRIIYDSVNLPPFITQASANPTNPDQAPYNVVFSGAATDPEGQSLTYTWDFGDGSSANGANRTHQYTDRGAFQASLAVSDGVHTTTSNSITINVGKEPVADIVIPLNTASFRASELIEMRGHAVEGDGTFSNNSFRWTVRFKHDTHFHPFMTESVGTPCSPPSGSSCKNFTVPISGHDFSDDTGFEITLDVTDSDGLTGSDTVSIVPDKVDLTFNSNVPGNITFNLDQLPRTGPFTHDSLIGFHHTISAPETVTSGGNLYVFDSWSNAPNTTTINITVPSVNRTYSAIYNNAGPAPTAGAYVQSGGVLTIEAEHFEDNVGADGAGPWLVQDPAQAGASNSQAIKADSGSPSTTAGAGSFTSYDAVLDAGTHDVWVRSRSTHTSNDSFFFQMDSGSIQNVAVGPDDGQWHWQKLGGSISVGTSGDLHMLKLFRRESGLELDKLVVTTNSGLDPQSLNGGLGPDESARQGGGGNSPPVLNPIGDRSVVEGSPQTIAFQASDIDASDALSISISGLPMLANGNVFFSDNGNGTAQLTVSPAPGDASSSFVTVTVSDDGTPSLSDSETFLLNVVSPNIGAFVQSGGVLSIETEHYVDNTAADGAGPWLLEDPAAAGASNAQAIKAADGTPTTTEGAGSSTTYEAQLQAGTQSVWVRFRAFGTPSNSFFFQVGGGAIYSQNVGPYDSQWHWQKLDNEITVSGSGVQLLTIYRREGDLELDKLVVSTDPNLDPESLNGGLGPVESGRAGGGNRAPVLNPIGMRTVDEGSSMDLDITAWDPDNDSLALTTDPGTLFGQAPVEQAGGAWRWTVSPPSGSAADYPVTVTVQDGGSPTLSDSEMFTLRVVDPAASGAFVQDGTTGMLVAEAENFQNQGWGTGANGLLWQVTDPAAPGASNARAIKAANGAASGAGPGGLYAFTTYIGDYSVTGTLQVWVRFRAFSSGEDSFFFEFNGGTAHAQGLNPEDGKWHWVRLTQPVNVSAPGMHLFRIYRRERNTEIDKIVLTPDANFVPPANGVGPAESPRAPSP